MGPPVLQLLWRRSVETAAAKCWIVLLWPGGVLCLTCCSIAGYAVMWHVLSLLDIVKLHQFT